MAPLALFFLAVGMFLVALFHLGIYMPIWLSVLTLILVSLFLVKGHLSKRVGMLMAVMWFVYALPFIHVIPYLWFDFAHENPEVLWGLMTNPYMLDEQVVELTAMIGAVGGIGFSLGISLNWPKATQVITPTHDGARQVESLSMLIWAMWVVAGVGFSWLAAPQETILTAVYTESQSMLEGANFSSAWMISYVLLIFAFCDAVLDGDKARRSRKMQWVTFAVAFVVIYLQLMRGDRESMPLVLGLFLIYFHWAPSSSVRRSAGKSLWTIGLLGVSLLAAAMLFGALRSAVAGLNTDQFLSAFADLYESGSIGASNLLYGTWSAVLLTPLSVAGDHIYDQLRLGLGGDYVDFLLSIPPGFIADAVGYIRPIDALNGPAWEMRYGIGGTHATVVPFLNFRMAGVLFVTAIWAYVLHTSERRVLKRLTLARLAFLGVMITIAPHWLWYGEKYVLNAFLIWLLLWWGYYFSLTLGRASKADSVRYVP